MPDRALPDSSLVSTTPDREPRPPWFSLAADARYFERDGIQAPLLMRNVSAPSVDGGARCDLGRHDDQS